MGTSSSTQPSSKLAVLRLADWLCMRPRPRSPRSETCMSSLGACARSRKRGTRRRPCRRTQALVVNPILTLTLKRAPAPPPATLSRRAGAGGVCGAVHVRPGQRAGCGQGGQAGARARVGRRRRRGGPHLPRDHHGARPRRRRARPAAWPARRSAYVRRLHALLLLCALRTIVQRRAWGTAGAGKAPCTRAGAAVVWDACGLSSKPGCSS